MMLPKFQFISQFTNFIFE